MDVNNCPASSMSSDMFEDSSAMINAVASLIARQQHVVKEGAVALGTPMLVLTNTPGKDALQASVVLGSIHESNVHKIGTVPGSSKSFIPSLEEVHALATANLVESTQRDIAQQLVEASARSHHSNEAGTKRVKKYKMAANKNVEKQDDCVKQVKKKTDGVNVAPVKSLSSVNPELKALVCSFEGCGRKFAWLTHLKYHELTHTNNRQFKCPDKNCGKTFYTNQRLNVHLRIHTGERPFKCSHLNCGKTFITAGNLRNHERIHTGEQPYVCDYCDCNRRFTEYSSLRKHKLTHSGDKPFKCKICDKKFTQSGSRQQHFIRHHLDEIRSSLKGKPVGQEDDDDVGDRREESNALTSPGVGNNVTKPMKSQVLVLNNTYNGLPSSESLVFSQSLTDHIVSVTTQTEDQHPLGDSDGLSLSHSLLSTDALQDASLPGKTDELVVLSETPIYRHQEQHGDIVYTSLGPEDSELASQVNCSGKVADLDYSNERVIHQEVTFPTADMSQTNVYSSHSGYIHEDFIGAEEVTVSEFQNIGSEGNNGFTSQSEYSGLKEAQTSPMDPLMEWDDQLHNS